LLGGAPWVSRRRRSLYHWTDGHTCSCYDFRRRQQACKHVIAHRLDATDMLTTREPLRCSTTSYLQQPARAQALCQQLARPSDIAFTHGQPRQRWKR
jgi:hypothetical protein